MPGELSGAWTNSKLSPGEPSREDPPSLGTPGTPNMSWEFDPGADGMRQGLSHGILNEWSANRVGIRQVLRPLDGEWLPVYAGGPHDCFSSCWSSAPEQGTCRRPGGEKDCGKWAQSLILWGSNRGGLVQALGLSLWNPEDLPWLWGVDCTGL